VKPFLGVIAISLLSAIIMCGADDKKGGGKQSDKKGTSKGDKGGGDGGSPPANVAWQTWGPDKCDENQKATAPPPGRDPVATFTYTVASLPDAAPPSVKMVQPFYLVPAKDDPTKKDNPTKKDDPTKKDNPTKLYAGQKLIVQIVYPIKPALPPDAAIAAVTATIPLITIDIGSTQATAINPNPVRQTQGISTLLSLSASTKIEPVDKLYACAYKEPLIGDTIPTVTITALVATPTDPLTLLQASLPQVHTLSYFNVATGIVASTIRDKSFPRVPSATATATNPAQYTTVPQNADPNIMPVLFFTAYLIRPIDAEVPFERQDWTPEPSIGFSLTSPATDFFFGGSSEFFKRNVQLVYGLHHGQTTHLVPGQANDPTSKDAPQTQKRFDNGAFVGLTFNIDFIKGLFSGGK
jgi:hypothetical protein